MVGIIAGVGAVFSMSRSDSDSLPNAVVSPTETPARTDAPAAPSETTLTTPTDTPYLGIPTPTLTLNEVFELPEKEAAKEIERQQLSGLTPTSYPTQIPKSESRAVVVARWGTWGTGDGEFEFTRDVAVASDGSVYVVDAGNNRIQKFTSDGVFIRKWGTRNGAIFYGEGDGEFSGPTAVAVASDGHVYVADAGNNRVQKFTSDGVFVKKWGMEDFYGLAQVHDIAVASDGSVYVAEPANNQIKKFTSDGVFVTRWGTLGTDDGQLSYPSDVAVASDGSVYVADADNRRIQKFTPDGVFVTKWGTQGTGDGEFSQIMGGVAVAFDGHVYVADAGNERIQEFTSEGVFVKKLGMEDLIGPVSAIALASDDSFYVAGGGNSNRIQKFSVVP